MSESKQQEACGNCKFGQFYPGTEGITGGGKCRRYPPRNHRIGGDHTVRAYMPHVSMYDWCGEYLPKPRINTDAEVQVAGLRSKTPAEKQELTDFVEDCALRRKKPK